MVSSIPGKGGAFDGAKGEPVYLGAWFTVENGITGGGIFVGSRKVHAKTPSPSFWLEPPFNPCPCPMSVIRLHRRAFLLWALLAATLSLSAQPAAPRPRDRTPTWLMPPVEGANLHYCTFASQLAGEDVSYLVYLPPGYEEETERRYPVVYWLHGIGGSQQGVPEMTRRLTVAIGEGKTPPFIMVFLNGMIRSSWVDAHDGSMPVERVSLEEVLPLVEATYRTIATRAGRMIEGFSMGGAGAAKWGFRHSDLFGSISILDGALHNPEDPGAGRMAASFERVYGGDRDYYADRNPWVVSERNADRVRGRTPVRIVTRTVGLGKANRAFSEHLQALGIDNEFYSVPDVPHSPNPLYAGIGDANWAFYNRVFAPLQSTP